MQSNNTNFNQKSEIVDIVQNIQKGQLPSDYTLVSEIEPVKGFLAQKEKESRTLEEEKTLHDARMFLDAFEQFLTEKGLSQKMRNLMEASRRVAENTNGPVTVSSNAIWRETQKFVASIRSIVPDLIQSRQFRESILSFVRLLRDIFDMKEKENQVTEKLENAFVEGDVELAKDTVKDTAEDIKDTGVKNLPEDKKKRLRESLKSFITDLNKNTNASKAFQKALNLWDMFTTELNAQFEKEKVDPDVQEVINASRELIDSFAPGKIDHFIQTLRQSVDMIQNDQELQNFLRDFRQFIRKGLETPELIDTDEYFDEGDELIQRGRDLTEKYKDNEILNNLYDEANDIINAVKSDEQIANFQYRASKLADDFVYTDITGRKHVDFDLISKLRAEITPFLIERIHDVPIPGFCIENEDYEYLQVDDLKVKLEDILPDHIKIHAKNDTDITLKDLENPTKSETAIKFRIEGMRPKFEDFQFRFKRRGVISMKDEGRASLFVAGKGIYMNLDFDLDVDTENRPVLTTAKVEVNVDTIYVNIKEAEHKFLLNMMTSLFAPKLKEEVQKALKQRFMDLGGEFATRINKRVFVALPLPTISSVGFAAAKVVLNAPGSIMASIEGITP